MRMCKLKDPFQSRDWFSEMLTAQKRMKLRIWSYLLNEKLHFSLVSAFPYVHRFYKFEIHNLKLKMIPRYERTT